MRRIINSTVNTIVPLSVNPVIRYGMLGTLKMLLTLATLTVYNLVRIRASGIGFELINEIDDRQQYTTI